MKKIGIIGNGFINQVEYSVTDDLLFEVPEVKQYIEIQKMLELKVIDIPNPKHNQTWKPKHKRRN